MRFSLIYDPQTKTISVEAMYDSQDQEICQSKLEEYTIIGQKILVRNSNLTYYNKFKT